MHHHVLVQLYHLTILTEATKVGYFALIERSIMEGNSRIC